MAKHKALRKPLPGFIHFLDKIDGSMKGIFIVTLIFLGIYWYTTYPVDNTQYLNSSAPNLPPQQRSDFKDGNIPEGFEPVLVYDATSRVPSSRVPVSALLIHALIVGMIIVYSANKDVERELIPAVECIENIHEYWDELRKNNKVSGTINLYTDFPRFKLKRTEADGKRIPYEWVIYGLNIDENGIPHHLRFYVNCFNGFVNGFLTSNGPFTHADICGRCGKDSDIKVITSEEFNRVSEMIRGISGAKKNI